MKTVNSLSGGKTSSYIAVHYPADIEVFALCCIDCHNAGATIDKRMKQMVNDRLQKYCSHYPEFVATSEDPKVLNPTSTFPPQNFPVIQHLQFLHIYCGYYKFSNSTELG